MEMKICFIEQNSKSLKNTNLQISSTRYEPNSLDSNQEAFKKCADEIPSDGLPHIVNFVYGSRYTLLVQSYETDDYRSVLALSYNLPEPVYLIKKAGTWIS